MTTPVRQKPQPKPDKGAQERRAPRGWPTGLLRHGSTSIIACLVVGCLTVAAGWHANGSVRRGEIDRMLRMSANAPQVAPQGQARGKLDRAHLKALAASAGR